MVDHQIELVFFQRVGKTLHNKTSKNIFHTQLEDFLSKTNGLLSKPPKGNISPRGGSGSLMAVVDILEAKMEFLEVMVLLSIANHLEEVMALPEGLWPKTP
jgi:hypothetical protein